MASILSPLPTPRTDSPEPSLGDLRARLLLALALINHRASPDLDADDVRVVRQALLGGWDAA